MKKMESLFDCSILEILDVKLLHQSFCVDVDAEMNLEAPAELPYFWIQPWQKAKNWKRKKKEIVHLTF